MKYFFQKFKNEKLIYFNVFCTRSPATTAMVVGNEAAQTPSRFNDFSSPATTTKGGAH